MEKQVICENCNIFAMFTCHKLLKNCDIAYKIHLKKSGEEGSSPCFVLSDRLFQVKSELKFILKNSILVDFVFWVSSDSSVYRSTMYFLPLVVNMTFSQWMLVLGNWSVLSLQSACEHPSINKYVSVCASPPCFLRLSHSWLDAQLYL